MGWLRKIIGEPGPKMVRVAVVRSQPEEELVMSLLREAEIPARTRRTAGFDLPEMMAAGPRDILVPEHLELDARSAIQPIVDDIRLRDHEQREGDAR